MRYFILAGEASGDLHGAKLIEEIQKCDTEAEIQAWGGDQMRDSGALILKHIKDLAFMGFVEVLQNIRTIMSNFGLAKEHIQSFKPDIVIFIDYPGFNLRMAEWTRKKGIRNAYYIAPQAWAWKKGRVKKMSKCIDKLFVILPFEKSFFESEGMPCEYVGHPLLDRIADQKKQRVSQAKTTNLGLIPGSRVQEIKTMLPVMARAAEQENFDRLLIAAAPNIDLAFYRDLLQTTTIEVEYLSMTEVLENADYALVTSGTATLETALHNVPQVVLYKGNPLSYMIAKRLVNIKYISLVNLILDKPILTELIQGEMNETNLQASLNAIMQTENRKNILENYKALHDLLDEGGAAKTVAKSIFHSLSAN